MRLPAPTPRKLVRALKRAGFRKVRQTGSHLILENPTTKKMVSVPIHAKDLKRGLVRGIIEEAGFTIKEFIKFL